MAPGQADRLYRGLLLVAAVFFAFEFLLHFFGLPLLEHDEIFLPTHDRYIALYGLTLGGLLTLLATSHRHDQALYWFTMVMLFLGGLNAVWISVTDGYQTYFQVSKLDGQLGVLGVGVVVWYVALKVAKTQAARR